MKYDQIKQNGLNSDVFHFVKMKVFINDAYHLGHLHILQIHWKVTCNIGRHHRKQLGQYCDRIVEQETLDVTA